MNTLYATLVYLILDLAILSVVLLTGWAVWNVTRCAISKKLSFVNCLDNADE